MTVIMLKCLRNVVQILGMISNIVENPGMSWREGVCLSGIKTSVVEAGDYFVTVNAATHELGHNLGAEHDGTGDASRCRSEDLFIMSGTPLEFHPWRQYTRNPWLFSTCSVKAFKKTLPDKECVHNKSLVYDKNEWTNFTAHQPGEVYSINEQCEFVMGHNSTYCGGIAADICRFMKCTDPKTGQCPNKNFSAARGTECGNDMDEQSNQSQMEEPTQVITTHKWKSLHKSSQLTNGRAFTSHHNSQMEEPTQVITTHKWKSLHKSSQLTNGRTYTSHHNSQMEEPTQVITTHKWKSLHKSSQLTNGRAYTSHHNSQMEEPTQVITTHKWKSLHKSSQLTNGRAYTSHHNSQMEEPTQVITTHKWKSLHKSSQLTNGRAYTSHHNSQG
ncbi:hypothetical protein CHS0354_017779 [Potamilus streckersoni]|uniref:Peptidase M12B domain-containing protein n=1 Tax=Potamilus streckersoni TaxID=2493646 RepID=A0AAE0T8T2_9BIVA|nr:hypothetical protein CHS0354_017779 [Potamilus streckersoni]